MKVIAIFNNKGGVGKSTLTYYLGHTLSLLGKKVLMVDADPQCNLTSLTMTDEKYIEVIDNEDDDNSIKTLHRLLKPIEIGESDTSLTFPMYQVTENLHLIPGKMSLCKFEEVLHKRWDALYTGDSLSIRTATAFKNLFQKYGEAIDVDYVLVDMSPSLGLMNKILLMSCDGFFSPVQPNIFNLQGILNTAETLSSFKENIEIIKSLIGSKYEKFPKEFTKCLGYLPYNVPRKDVEKADFSNINKVFQEKFQAISFGDWLIETHDMPSMTDRNEKSPMWDCVPLARYQFFAEEFIQRVEFI